MPISSKLFSGTGNPNGVIKGNPGDLFQDRSSGAVWIRTTALTPFVWKIIQVADIPPPSPTPLAFLIFGAGLELDLSGGGGTTIIPYAPGTQPLFTSRLDPARSRFGIMFGASNDSASSEPGKFSWVVTRAGTLTSLRVNIETLSGNQPGGGAVADFEIQRSPSCNGPFVTVMSITGLSAPGCYDTAGAVAVGPGDRILFKAKLAAVA